MHLRPPTASLPFVGRETELALLGARLDTALAGNGTLALLVGEPGIGKTRLAEELTRLAGGCGARVLWARCYEGEGAPAFWPWVQVFRGYARGCDPASFAAELGPYAAAIASLTPELLPPDIARSARREGWNSGAESAEARFRLFDSITAFLKAAARSRPVVLALDDLHWADVPSLLCLQFLAQEVHDAPILAIGTYRDIDLDRDDARTRILAGLGRDRRHLCLRLAGLSEGAVAGLVNALVDGGAGEVGSALTSALHRETEGNPLFVQELVRHLAETGRLDESGSFAAEGAPSVPESIRDVIDRRLARLSPASVRVLRLAAVLGQEFRLAVLTRAADLEGVPLLEGLGEALAARVITTAPGAVGSYRFSHALIRDTLYDDLSLPVRARLHLQAGEALEGFHAPSLEQHLGELAYHFMQAAPAGAERATDYARRAGDAALARFAYEEAARNYGLALQALDLRGVPDSDERCALLIAQGDALNRAGETVAARERLLLAAEIARARAASNLLVRAALALAELQEETGRVDEARVALLDEALAALGNEPTAARALLLARLAKARHADPQSAALGREAIAIARQLDDPRVLIEVLFATRYALWAPDNLAERLANGAEMARLAGALGDVWWSKAAHAFRYSDLLELGDRAAAEVAREVIARPTSRRQTAHDAWYELVLRAMQALMAGRLAEGEQLAWQALAAGQQAQIPDALQSFGVQLAFARYMQGRFGELEGSVKGLVEQYPESPSWRAALALVYAETGRPAEARTQFDRLTAGGFGAFSKDRSRLIGLANTAEVCAFLEDKTHAEVLYDLLVPYERQNIVIALATVWYGPIARQLGLLAGALGRWDGAARHFEDALAMLARMGSPPLIACVQAEYAGLLLRRGRREDREHARALLAEAAAIARELGLGRVTALVERLHLDEPPADAEPRPALPDGLTTREAEVLALLAAGRTNQEIAAALVVSPFTVARHITNLYAKIGARGRADATAYALRHHLL
jgi:predicted ATPase/DNA-binding CsgD family transcriptional regulator